jgi:nucleotide-binding universal stress UspA family protein
VLLAYDGSASGQKLLRFVAETPLLRDLDLHILTIGKTSDDSTATDRLNSAKPILEQAGLDATCQLLVGNPETVIANYIEAQAIDLLVMGAYGHSRIRHLVIGSTTAQVLRSSHIPVLVFR